MFKCRNLFLFLDNEVLLRLYLFMYMYKCASLSLFQQLAFNGYLTFISQVYFSLTSVATNAEKIYFYIFRLLTLSFFSHLFPHLSLSLLLHSLRLQPPSLSLPISLCSLLNYFFFLNTISNFPPDLVVARLKLSFIPPLILLLVIIQLQM